MATIEEKRKALLEQKLKEMADMGVTKRLPEEYPSFDQPFQVMSANEVGDDKPKQNEEEREKEISTSEEGLEVDPQSTKATPRKTKAIQKKDFAEYQQRFLTPIVLENRTQFAMNKETVELLRHIIQDLAVRTTISAYIENILRDHIGEYRDMINQVTAKRRRKETIPE
ncbi:DUF3408 domain-containing protein [Porphyromonas levii]|uniref:DUF3408 domain-containing protein n=1 Tax=Porphyromonas levii TaxID=28114 RepID=UPI001B8AF934|nr:DUF3408 domain-containing protein [Porphyromonas levii]MBR8713884.1 hypothetical protein [Porphyromonas levii]MBR8715896.1 hypothetical protein [Porphyromonas levii]MBR8728444.1 hypothetical protein [Porphyromonas levii]MBR8736756.1 hypothetical protein [Porphyromonas levii]MBR8769890.1 hypothetical protein [Porphyromonas levii]